MNLGYKLYELNDETMKKVNYIMKYNILITKNVQVPRYMLINNDFSDLSMKHFITDKQLSNILDQGSDNRYFHTEKFTTNGWYISNGIFILNNFGETIVLKTKFACIFHIL